MVSDAFTPACPICGSAARVYKLSQVYVAGITETADRSRADEELLIDVFGGAGSPTELSQLVSSFAPPAALPRRRLPLHPDMVMLIAAVGAMVGVVFVNNSRPGLLWPTLAAGGLVAAAYLFSRRSIVRRFLLSRQVLEGVRQTDGKITGRWLQTYFCSRDRCVFNPSRADYASLDQVKKYLSNVNSG